MITIVFLFHCRGKLEFKLECELGFGFAFEYKWIWNGKECEHDGSVDFVGPAIRCQCYSTPIVILNCCDVFNQTVNMNIYCNIINVIRK